MDTLKFCTSIPQRFKLTDIFEINGTVSEDEYILKAVVCFLGAHYMTYIKNKSSSKDSIPHWKLYDDYKPI